MLTTGSEHRRITVAGRPVRASVLLGAIAVVVIGAWWLWPTLTGADDDVNVLVVADGALADARRPIEQRVREAGLSIEWYEASDWCDDAGRLASVIEDTEPGQVVMMFDDGPECAETAATAIAGTHAVAVLVPGAGPDRTTLTEAGFDTIDPTRLIGAPGAAVTLPCEWWEELCAPGGTVVRDSDGRLTEAGGERLARVLVAGL